MIKYYRSTDYDSLLFARDSSGWWKCGLVEYDALNWYLSDISDNSGRDHRIGKDLYIVHPKWVKLRGIPLLHEVL